MEKTNAKGKLIREIREEVVEYILAVRPTNRLRDITENLLEDLQKCRTNESIYWQIFLQQETDIARATGHYEIRDMIRKVRRYDNGRELEESMRRILQQDGSVREKYFSEISKLLSDSLKSMEAATLRLEQKIRRLTMLSVAASTVVSALVCAVLYLLAG